MKSGTRVKMVKTMAPVEVPNGTEGVVTSASERMVVVQWSNGYVLPMFLEEVIETANELF